MGVVLDPILAGALLEATNVPGIAFYLGSIMLILAILSLFGFRFLVKKANI